MSILAPLTPFFVAIALWFLPLLNLRWSMNYPAWLFVYFVLLTLFAAGFSVWWVMP